MTLPLQTIAWQGFLLQVPRDWNVTLHRGNSKLGTLSLSDLHQTQLEIRWRTVPRARAPRHAGTIFTRQAKNAPVTLNTPVDWSIRQAHRLDRDGLTLLILRATTRLYELSMKPGAHDLPALAHSFRDQGEEELWRWQLYGIAGNVPKNFRLRKTTLLPGRAQLDFSAFRQKLTLGSWSLADQLLQQRSLRDWAAEVPLVRNHPKGRWRKFDGEERFTLLRGKLLPSRTILSLLHVPEQNLIRWQQVTAPAAVLLPFSSLPHL